MNPPAPSAASARIRSTEPRLHTFDMVGRLHARRAEGLPAFNLAAGQPSAPTPAPILRAAAAALNQPDLGYTQSIGMQPLRERIAAHYGERYAVTVQADDVVLTTGSSQGFQLAVLCAFQPGDRVAVTRPGYSAYTALLELLGCEVVEVPVGASTGYQFTPELLAAAAESGGLAGVILSNPSTPTGGLLDKAELTRVIEHCTARDIRVISDEVYHGVVFERPADEQTSWTVDRESIVLNSFSKYFAMTGWRLGWMLVPKHLRRAIDAATSTLSISPPSISQFAAMAAFEPETAAICRGLVDDYAANRALLLDALAAMGVTTVAPNAGAFYLYADFAPFTDDATALCHRLLDTTGVALVPGQEFDPVDGDTWARLSFSGRRDEVEAGVEALAGGLASGSFR